MQVLDCNEIIVHLVGSWPFSSGFGRVQFLCGFGGVMDPTKSKWTMPNAKLVLGLAVLVGQCPLASFGRVHF